MVELVPSYPSLIFDGFEGVRVQLTREGDALIDADSARLTPERSMALCFALLDCYAPEIMNELERVIRAQRVRVVGGSDDTGGQRA